MEQENTRWPTKEIIGTVIGMMPFAIAFAVWMATITARVSVLEVQMAAANARNDAQDAQASTLILRIEARIAAIEGFLMKHER